MSTRPSEIRMNMLNKELWHEVVWLRKNVETLKQLGKGESNMFKRHFIKFEKNNFLKGFKK